MTQTLPVGVAAKVEVQSGAVPGILGRVDRNHRGVMSALAALVVLLSTYPALLRVSMAESVVRLVAKGGLVGHVCELAKPVIALPPPPAAACPPSEPSLAACETIVAALKVALHAPSATMQPPVRPSEKAPPARTVLVSLPKVSVGVPVPAEPHDGEPEAPDADAGGQGEPPSEGNAPPKAPVEQATFVQDEVPDRATPVATPEPGVAPDPAGGAGGN